MRDLSPCRLDILRALGDGEKSGGDLAAELRRLQTNICRDLRIMQRAGLVTKRRDDYGNGVLYRAARTKDGAR